MKIEIYLNELHCGDWVAGSIALDIKVYAGTPRQALVAFGNKLKRIKKEKLEEALNARI